MFWTAAPVLKYHQKTSNSIFLGSLASAFHSIGHKRSVPAILNFIEESLTLQTNKFRNRIHFSNNIMTNIMHIIGEQRLKYNLNLLHKKDVFEILKNVSEYVKFGTVNGLAWKCESCYQYSKVLDISLQL